MTRQDNANSKQYLELIVKHTVENLKILEHAPSVQFQDVPPDLLKLEIVDEPNPDKRTCQAEEDKRIEHPSEFYAGDKDNDQHQPKTTAES